MSLEVLKPGLCTTFQDAGRSGYQHIGVPVNGPMDAQAQQLANLLVGNRLDSGTLEMTLQGPVLRFDARALIALAGADLGARLNGQALLPNQAVVARPGALLEFGQRRFGARAYLAVAGGFIVEPILGSVSTYRRGAYAGVLGRALLAGDRLGFASSFRNAPRIVLPAALTRSVEREAERAIRVIAGGEWQHFTEQARHNLLNSPYRIGNDSERMGYRLQGDPLTLEHPLELLSEAVSFGTLQVPPSGQPIVLMADRQTTGGYPRIANVISVDLPLLAQRLPGDAVRFELTTIQAAQSLAVKHARLLTQLEHAHA
ncbi:biotin-dependent carboxyltransferase family protein [Pseudomonas sp. 21LCFQ02]|uniref:5-oxoprolinase subunit C family protein n=1 Tax=Pseudomonas sp. 21LCFQ02 TaxID=2957505 RepID=UPI00209AD668|nr:biotin-dependent carboxyltransferase family protein [Pseudomonas sp. 21LCFQ02]MCO8169371.1 biotin-dependent carboxyltransferase family protein [Pseudomonas sp. 21LCFQ02]